DGIDVHLPNPALIPLLKGNVGEFIFSKVLSKLGVSTLSLDELVSLLGPAVYERYDTFVLDGSALICVDVKRWAAGLENEELSIKTLRGAETKRQEMIKL
ncbi:hypothetical protein, partial [Pseudomonas viridiflava]